MNTNRSLKCFRKILQFVNSKSPQQIITRNVGAYEGHGKTVMNVLNHKDCDVYKIISYSQLGFRLHTGVFAIGPIILYEDKILHWNIKGDDAIDDDSLEFFYRLVPPLDLLVIGIGDDKNLSKVGKKIIQSVTKRGIGLELLPSTKAAQTFNFVSGIRNVAGAFVPPRYYELYIDDMMGHNKRTGLNEGRRFVDADRENLILEAQKLGIKP